MSDQTKYIFVTGGVLSSLGKGIASASISAILSSKGYKVRNKKMDPYLNVDPGTMSPAQHGECYVTDDGAEADLDLGHYERFSNNPTSKFDSISAGRIYDTVLKKERRGDYLGKTVQIVPHVTNEIKEFIQTDITDEDFVIVELGGTVGDIEGLAFLEAIRQTMNELGRERSMSIHLTLVPYLSAAGEVKTKPTQRSINELQGFGIFPSMIMCRCDRELTEDEKAKIAMFGNVSKDAVISAPNVNNIYEIPVVYNNQGISSVIMHHFGLTNGKPDLSRWEEISDVYENPERETVIAVVGKYMEVRDSYKSLSEALIHGGIANRTKVIVKWVDAEYLEKDDVDFDQVFDGVKGILVPGGFGERGTEGKIKAARYAREKMVPYFGICLGMQMAVIEACRNILGIKNANSTELSEECTPIVSLITEWEKDGRVEKRTQNSDMGGTMRLGAYPCRLSNDSLIASVYGMDEISERHRHRYEVDMKYAGQLEENGFIFAGKSPDGLLPETVEIKGHPWFIGVQFHPELKSRPLEPHPLFVSFIKAGL